MDLRCSLTWACVVTFSLVSVFSAKPFRFEKGLCNTTSISKMTTTAQRPLLAVPVPLAKLFSYFPLKTYPPSTPVKPSIVDPLLWIHPPPPSVPGKESVLSKDIECLKWQAHIALRGVRNVSVRWDISQDGALEGRLPNLQIPSEQVGGKLLAAQDIPTWIDENFGALDDLEGYKDAELRDESHAWIALLEGDVHAALVSHLNPHECHTFHHRYRVGIGPTPTFLLLSNTPPASPFHHSAAHRDHPHDATCPTFWLLLSSHPLRCASFTKRHRCTIPRCDCRAL